MLSEDALLGLMLDLARLMQPRPDMIMDRAVLPFAVAALVPLLAYVMWTDLKEMRIPNALCLAILLVFVPTGLMGLPIETFGWRLLHAGLVFVAFYGLYQVTAGKVGAGDLKLVVAFVPYVPGGGIKLLADFAIVMTLLTLVVFFALRAGLRGRTTLAAINVAGPPARDAGGGPLAALGAFRHWLRHQYVPYGWVLSSTFIAYLLYVQFGLA